MLRLPPPAQIMITSTAANGTMEEAETPTLIAVSNGGYKLTLGSPLQFDHLGETRFLAGGHSIEMRADVALLTRNVRVQGDSPFSQLDRHGGHIMMHSRGARSEIPMPVSRLGKHAHHFPPLKLTNSGVRTLFSSQAKLRSCHARMANWCLVGTCAALL